jgi:hypothetical protein
MSTQEKINKLVALTEKSFFITSDDTPIEAITLQIVMLFMLLIFLLSTMIYYPIGDFVMFLMGVNVHKDYVTYMLFYAVSATMLLSIMVFAIYSLTAEAMSVFSQAKSLSIKSTWKILKALQYLSNNGKHFDSKIESELDDMKHLLECVIKNDQFKPLNTIVISLFSLLLILFAINPILLYFGFNPVDFLFLPMLGYMLLCNFTVGWFRAMLSIESRSKIIIMKSKLSEFNLNYQNVYIYQKQVGDNCN